MYSGLQIEKTEDMDVDTPPFAVQSHVSQKQSVASKLEIFCYLLVTIFLIDQNQLEEVHFPSLKPESLKVFFFTGNDSGSL